MPLRMPPPTNSFFHTHMTHATAPPFCVRGTTLSLTLKLTEKAKQHDGYSKSLFCSLILFLVSFENN